MDPRSLAKRAEAYLRSTGIADTAYFGPEPEFFIFDDVRWSATSAGAMYRIDSEEAAWNSERAYEDGNMGHRPGPKGGYFPGAAGGFSARHSFRHVPGHGGDGGSRWKSTTTRWRPPARPR